MTINFKTPRDSVLGDSTPVSPPREDPALSPSSSNVAMDGGSNMESTDDRKVDISGGIGRHRYRYNRRKTSGRVHYVRKKHRTDIRPDEWTIGQHKGKRTCEMLHRMVENFSPNAAGEWSSRDVSWREGSLMENTLYEAKHLQPGETLPKDPNTPNVSKRYANHCVFADSANYVNEGICVSIPKVHRKDITVEQFYEKYMLTQTPVIVQGCMDDWPAMTEWNLDNLNNRFPHQMFKCGEDDDGRRLRMKFKYYKVL